MLVAIYARHSSDKQEGSSQDQIDRCRQYCQQRGYVPTGVYRDEGVSGASMLNRPGIKRLLSTAIDGAFERIVTEDLSRISRDQGDIVTFFKKMTFIGVPLESIAEGLIGELHIGLKGTMNALYLKDLADKTRRGQIASVLKGAVPGGKVYGYDIVRKLDENGEAIRGARSVNEQQAAVVRQIFTAYAAGTSLKRICADLNALGIPAPNGGHWAATTLVGTAARGTGILRQTLYKGTITFNKMHFRKHPETGRRLSIPRPPSEWVHAPIPELAIIEESLFDQVQKMIDERSSVRRALIEARQAETAAAKAARDAARQQKWRLQQARPRQKITAVFSGRLHCAEHGHKFLTVRHRLYGCPVPNCSNSAIRYEEVLPKCLDALAALTEDQVEAYFAGDEVASQIAAHEKAIAEAETQAEGHRARIRTLLDALGAHARTETVRQVLDEQEQEIRRLGWERIRHERRRDALKPSPQRIAKALAVYRAMLAKVRADETNTEACLILRSCVTRFDVAAASDRQREACREIFVSVHFDFPRVLEIAN